MVVASSCLRPPVVNTEGDGIMPVTTILDAVSVDQTTIEGSGTRSKRQRVYVVNTVP